MDPATRRLIEAIHHGPSRYVLALTGGGASAAGLLLSVPGGSRTVLEVCVPYDERALADFLGRRPEHFCSLPTSADMADRALGRARWLAPGQEVAGVGSTASLATDRRIQLLLIGFAFGAFIEGASGFGTPIAICAAMLIGLWQFDRGELLGILSMRDIVRCWTEDGATSEVPADAARA